MSPNGQCTANFIVDQIHNHIHRSGIIPLDRLQLNSDRIDDDMLDTNDKWYGIGSPSHLLLRLSTTRTWIRHKQCVADISFLLGWWYVGWLAEPVNWDRCCLPVEICRESMADTEQMRFRVILFCCVKKGHPRLRAIKTDGTGMKGRAGRKSEVIYCSFGQAFSVACQTGMKERSCIIWCLPLYPPRFRMVTRNIISQWQEDRGTEGQWESLFVDWWPPLPARPLLLGALGDHPLYLLLWDIIYCVDNFNESQWPIPGQCVDDCHVVDNAFVLTRPIEDDSAGWWWWMDRKRLSLQHNAFD